MEALVGAGFDPNGVALLDPRTEGSRDIVLNMCRDAYANRQKLCIHCADGNALTAVVMADWLLTDYIGGDNMEEVRAVWVAWLTQCLASVLAFACSTYMPTVMLVSRACRHAICWPRESVLRASSA